MKEKLSVSDFNRGVLLSYSTKYKNELCKDLYHAQLYEEGVDKSLTEEDPGEPPLKKARMTNVTVGSDISGMIEASVSQRRPSTGESVAEEATSSAGTAMDVDSEMKVTDDPTNSGLPIHALVVKTVIVGEKALPEHDLYFTCALLNSKTRKPSENLYLFSSAFLSGWYYISTLVDQHRDRAMLSHYLIKSPEFINLSRNDLEEQYVNMRQGIGMFIRANFSILLMF